MKNIQKIVWDYIDRRIELQKVLMNGLMNTSALARRISKELNLAEHIDAIISSVRRYECKQDKKERHFKIYALLRKSRISTKTKLASILLKRNDTSEEQVASIYSKIKVRRDSVLRVFEVTNYIKIIIDEDLFRDVRDIFSDKDVEKIDRNLSEITINYRSDITKISGIFAAVANELAMNDISIIDSMICNWEHIIIVTEDDLQKTVATVMNLMRTENRE
jgi:hypothetical protein